MIRLVAAILVVTALVGCSSIPIGTAGKLRTLDYLNDDVASLLLAFDLPPELEPAQGASTLSFDITTPASGAKHIEAKLVAADADELAGTLPPPSGERNYYLFGFSDADKQAIREAQAWARGLPPGNNAFSISLSPRLCRTAEINPAKTTVSALVALPGATGLSPLLSNQPLNAVLQGAEIPACAGHSG
ncbi:hypothetical protein PRN20_05375 [Devosia sp. ZB163]|uniref:hypothetical protein n=1 Tax=Devosia sp. ZB163 TaxID=3025938 RepID=UPI002362CC87|nr:hypothetical protein [Devosia sp. ZB163]MDC9823156.1 hypothetical protein [Devosia sp. ZB163]